MSRRRTALSLPLGPALALLMATSCPSSEPAGAPQPSPAEARSEQGSTGSREGRRSSDRASGLPPQGDRTATTQRGLYEVSIRPELLPIPLRETHRWTLRVTDSQGAPMLPARVLVGGGMPSHGHGLPSRPHATRHLGPGELLVEGVLFHMAGSWELSFVVDGPLGRDEVSFDLELRDRASPSAAPGDEHLQLLHSLSLAALPEAPVDPSNRASADARAAALGRALFADPGLSRTGTVACSHCHDPQRHFTDGLPLARGLGVAARHTPTLVGVAHASWFTWDGRRDSLWAQALAPLEAAAEMGSTRLQVVRYVLGHPQHGPAFRILFGAPPKLPAAPAAGPFGDASAQRAWDALGPAERRAIDSLFASVGKVLAAFQRELRPTGSRFDRYVADRLGGRASEALSPKELRGLALFVDPERTRCTRCHNGPLLSNHDFHDVGTGALSEPPYDFGRAVGLEAARVDPFNCAGAFSDAPPEGCAHLRFPGEAHGLRGAFKVPTLRNVAETAPYMHDGRFSTLEEVLAHYREPPALEASRHELIGLRLSDEESQQIIAFLGSLTDSASSRPLAPIPASERP